MLTSLELPEDPQPHLGQLADKRDTAYRVVADRAQQGADQPATVVTDGRLHVDKLDPQDTSTEATELSRLCAAMLPDADYGPRGTLTPRHQHLLDLELIRRNWPDLLRVAGSLATGAMKASELMRLTQGGGSPATLCKALAEGGRIAKTLHMLVFINVDETYRRRIHSQLNT